MPDSQTKKAPEKKIEWNRGKVFFVVARLILGGIFIFASVDKIIHPAAFAEAVYNYPELNNSLFSTTQAVNMYVRFTNEANNVLNRYPNLRKLLH